MQAVLNSSIPELARRLQLRLGSDRGELPALEAIHDRGLVDQLVSLVQNWPDSDDSTVPDQAIAQAYFLIAKATSSLEHCRAALDYWPVHEAALSLFEELTDSVLTDELCARYQVFVEDAPLHGICADTQARILDKLLRAQEAAELNEESQALTVPSNVAMPRPRVSNETVV